MSGLVSKFSSYWLDLLRAHHFICIRPVPIQQIGGAEVVLRHEGIVCNDGFGVNEKC